MTVKDRIRQYVNGAVSARGQTSAVGDDEDLLQALDSLQVLRMMLALEKEFSVRIENSDFTPENLGTVERLTAFIARKQGESARSARPLAPQPG